MPTVSESETVSFERAFLVDGLFCVVVGLVIAVRTRWLENALALPNEWLPVVAGVVTVGWGCLLVVAARFSASRSVLRAVAVINSLVVAGALIWLAIDWDSMTRSGLVAVAVLAACVMGFAVYQAVLLRR